MEGAAPTEVVNQFSEATKGAFVNKTTVPNAAKPADATPAPADVVEKPADATPAPVAVATPPPADSNEPRELTDEEFDALLAKRTKGRIKSISDLDEPAPVKTPEQIEIEAKEKKKNALAWAIANNLTDPKDYDRSVVVGSKTEREIALELFAADALEFDKDLSAEEIEERFKDHYREDLEDEDPIRKLHIKSMSKLVGRYRDEVNGKVSNIETSYDSHLSSQQSLKAFNKQVGSVLKDELPKSLNFKYKYAHPDGTDHEVEVPFAIDADTVEGMRKSYINNEGVYNAIKGGKKEIAGTDIVAAAMYDLKANIFESAVPKLMEEVAKKVRMDVEAHYKNIPTRRVDPLGTQSPSNNTPSKETALQFHNATANAFSKPYRN